MGGAIRHRKSSKLMSQLRGAAGFARATRRLADWLTDQRLLSTNPERFPHQNDAKSGQMRRFADHNGKNGK